MRMGFAGVLLVLMVAGPARAQQLTADKAVSMALQRNTQVVLARATVEQARAGLYSAWSGVLPHLSVSLSRSGTWSPQLGSQTFGSNVSPPQSHFSSYRTTPAINGSMNLIDLSAMQDVRSARSDIRAARLRESSAHNDVALLVREQFYNTVTAIHLVGVNTEALRVARENERRVRALFEVGSVSRSDVLQAQVQTAQSELDSLNAAQQVVNQRVALASVVGVDERNLGEVDTTLAVRAETVDEARLLSEAERQRPDLRAAEASVSAAHSALSSAHLARVPSLSLSGTALFNLRSSSGWNQDVTIRDSTGTVIAVLPGVRLGSASTTDREYQAQLTINWDVFDGLLIESREASARASLLNAEATRDQLRRNLAGEVHQAIVGYDQAQQQETVAERQLAEAQENLKLTQEKYNVGSATILDLNTAQVSLQRAESQFVAAQAAIRVAEAQITHVRGTTP
jgi:outer membrane protein